MSVLIERSIKYIDRLPVIRSKVDNKFKTENDVIEITKRGIALLLIYPDYGNSKNKFPFTSVLINLSHNMLWRF